MPRALFPAMAASVFGGGTVALGFLYAAPGVGAGRLGRSPPDGWPTYGARGGR